MLLIDQQTGEAQFSPGVYAWVNRFKDVADLNDMGPEAHYLAAVGVRAGAQIFNNLGLNVVHMPVPVDGVEYLIRATAEIRGMELTDGWTSSVAAQAFNTGVMNGIQRKVDAARETEAALGI